MIVVMRVREKQLGTGVVWQARRTETATEPTFVPNYMSVTVDDLTVLSQ